MHVRHTRDREHGDRETISQIIINIKEDQEGKRKRLENSHPFFSDHNRQVGRFPQR